MEGSCLSRKLCVGKGDGFLENLVEGRENGCLKTMWREGRWLFRKLCVGKGNGFLENYV